MGIDTESQECSCEGINHGTGAGACPNCGAGVGSGRHLQSPTSQDDIKARENDIAFRLAKSGSGYVLEGFDGLRATSSYVRGNRIGATGRMQAPDGRWATFKVDYEVNGNQLTGTSRGEGEDGSLIVLSVTCTRQ